MIRTRVRHYGDTCKRGHAFTEENTRIRRNGYRACRTCAKEYRKIWQPIADQLSFDEQAVLANYEPTTESGCWIWLGSFVRRGYGAVRINGTIKTASRIFYEAHVGPIPPGLVVCHKCDTRICVNPDHLFVGTVSDNAQDMKRKGRAYRGGAKNPWNRGLRGVKSKSDLLLAQHSEPTP